MSSTRFYWVLPGITGFYWVLPRFTMFYLVLPRFTGFYLVVIEQSVTELNSVGIS